ncbi:MAG: hypothetical protein ABI794_15970 [Betaproteobacteria bacterium]
MKDIDHARNRAKCDRGRPAPEAGANTASNRDGGNSRMFEGGIPLLRDVEIDWEKNRTGRFLEP